jgi:outer membrane immunogenic protein
MTIRAFSLALAAAAIIAGPAAAADVFGAPRPGGYSWTGPYVGVNLGYQWGSTENNPTNPSGIAGGLQAGYNWHIGNFVIGAEGDLQLSGADDMLAPWKFHNPWFGTLRGRGGIALNNVMIYGTLGSAFGGVRAENTALGISESKTHGGWTAGLGMEVALGGTWSARAEYLYIDLSGRGYALTGATNAIDSSFLRLGVNYRFGGP